MKKQRIIFCGYRKWAFGILKSLKPDKYFDIVLAVTTKEKEAEYEKFNALELNPNALGEEMNYRIFSEKKPDIILFYGWSWMAPKKILDLALCVCLHPSPLPKYRGGSPLQRQIMAGEKEGAVTLIRMTEGIDNGPVLAQKKISLEGELNDIFERMEKTGAELTGHIIKELAEGHDIEKPQDESKATFFKRRKPGESEIKPEDFRKKTAEEMHNFVRALQEPYPNAFIVCKDGKKLHITKTRAGD